MPSAVLNIEPEHLTGTLSKKNSLSGTLSSGNSLSGTVEKNASRLNYELLTNKPLINSVVLQGNLSARDLGLGNVYYDTTANWDRQTSLVAEQAAVYIYSDYQIIYDEVENPIFVAGIKIGDGTSYLADIPFITDRMAEILLEHISNMTIHITAAEREFWNNKVSAYIDTEDAEALVLSKTNFIVEDN